MNLDDWALSWKARELLRALIVNGVQESLSAEGLGAHSPLRYQLAHLADVEQWPSDAPPHQCLQASELHRLVCEALLSHCDRHGAECDACWGALVRPLCRPLRLLQQGGGAPLPAAILLRALVELLAVGSEAAPPPLPATPAEPLARLAALELAEPYCARLLKALRAVVAAACECDGARDEVADALQELRQFVGKP